MMAAMNDPRIYFAAERTLLAWVRTSLGLMGMGFVVARFALFVKIIAAEEAKALPARGLSVALGIGLVLLGAITVLTAAVQHGRYLKTLGPNELPPGYSTRPARLLAYAMALAGIGLAILLAT